MGKFGSHVSAAGGVDKAVERALQVGCDCIQVFTKNNNRWAAKPLTEEAVAAWRAAWDGSGLSAPIAHASYLINLAAPDSELFAKSVDALVVEMERANLLGLEGLVVHPGAFTKSDEATGLARVVDGVTETLGRVEPGTCRLLLENTAGQGTCLGHTVEQLAAIWDGVDRPDRLGICLDTCHAHAAGYAVHAESGLNELRTRIRDRFPAAAVRAVHLNDSKKPLGSRVDRHEHIGGGEIGREGFRHLLADPLFRDVPGYLETEKGDDPESGEPWDVINLRTLRELAPK